MKVIVAGATGAVGRPLVRALRDSGHDVIGITRTSAGASALNAVGATAVIADALDREALVTAFAEQTADAVINELTALTKAPARYADMEPTNELRKNGSANLVEVARLVGAKRFLTQSIFFGYGYRDFGSTVITEETPFGSPQGNRTDSVLAALSSAETQARSLPGVVGIALRYGLFYGGDVDNYVGMLQRRALPVPTGHRGTLALIHHDDAARATVAALERGTSGAYNIVDDRPTTWRELVEGIALTRNAPRPIPLPGWVLRAAAPYAGKMMTGVNMHVSNAKAK
ncbi:MAG: NAD(P)-dependent oxidoreductase, partial [Microbacterium sp.]